MTEPKRTIIRVLGLGGGGQNAVDRMLRLGIEGIEFIAANTDAQVLATSLAPVKIHLGPGVTRGLGAGSRPEVGERAADESREEMKAALVGADMIFLTAGLGGGTGTGAIPIAAEVARATGALTIAIVTTPFSFEGAKRMANAQQGLLRLRPLCDTLITVPNDKLLPLVGRNATLQVAMQVADEVLRQGVQGIAEVVNRAGLINVDFANIRALMQFTGNAMMAIGQAKGEGKALAAARQALSMPLLDVSTFDAASGLLVHFTGGEDLSLYEVNQAMEAVQKAAPRAELVHGITLEPSFTGRAQVILIATGLGSTQISAALAATSDMVIHRPAARPEATPVPQPAHLAEALFHQVVTSASAAPAGGQPWVISAPPAPDTNDIDMPAFLRRRRSLREYPQGVQP